MRGVAHVTKWDEQRVLDYFYQMARSSDVDRIALLKQISDVAINRPSDWDGGVIREEARKAQRRLWGSRCFSCRTEARKVYWHHVIQVQHGGSNTPRNQVLLCARCHREIHPWLDKPTTIENRGFAWIGDFAARALRKLEAAWGGKVLSWKRNRARWF
jgi:hypothetical protein